MMCDVGARLWRHKEQPRTRSTWATAVRWNKKQFAGLYTDHCIGTLMTHEQHVYTALRKNWRPCAHCTNSFSSRWVDALHEWGASVDALAVHCVSMDLFQSANFLQLVVGYILMHVIDSTCYHGSLDKCILNESGSESNVALSGICSILSLSIHLLFLPIQAKIIVSLIFVSVRPLQDRV